MQVFRYSVVVAAIILLSGCSIHPQTDYAKKASIEAPLTMSKGLSLRTTQNYYPLPRKPNLEAKTPSLVPPGSDLQQYKPKKTAGLKKSKRFAMAKWSEADTGEPILVLLQKLPQAWAEIGKALHATQYQILDQDHSMSSYYILDAKATGKEVTEKTPIYRVYIKKGKNNSSKVVLMSETNKMVSAKIAKRVLGELEQHLV